jgi:hypothetical protein
VFREASGVGGFYWGTSPYYKTIAARGTRIFAQPNDGSQWYPETAAIANPAGATVPDMNPAHIIREVLTVVKGYSAARIDDAAFTAAADALHAEGFGISAEWVGEESADDFVQSIKETIDAQIYINPTTGKWTIKLIRNDYTVGALPVLGKAQVKRVDDFSAPNESELLNCCAVTYWDHAEGSTVTVQSDDPAMIIEAGEVKALNRDYSEQICSADLAQRIAQRDRIAASAPVRSATLTCTRAAASLMPGDPFVLDWPALLDEPTVMRVVATKRGGLLNHKVVLTVIEDVFTLDATAPVAIVPPGWIDPDTVELAQAVPLAIEAPYFEVLQRYGPTQTAEFLATTPDAGMILATAAQSDAAINAIVTGDGVEWPTLADLSPRGTLTALVTYTATAIAITWTTRLPTVGTHIQIGNELMRFDGLSGGLSLVGRGVLDTVPVQHESGAAAWAWDVFAVTDEVERAQGEIVDIALRLRNNTRVGLVSADVPVTLDARAVRPYPPGRLRIGGVAYPADAFGALALTWAHRNRLTQGDQIIDEAAASITPETGTTYSLRAVRVDTSAVLNSQTGITGTTATVPVLAYDGDVRIEVWSLRDGWESWQRAAVVIDYLRAERRVTEDDEDRITEDGELRILES